MRAPIRPASCRATYRDVDELEGFFEHLAGELYEPGLRGSSTRCSPTGSCAPLFVRAPCSMPAEGRPAAGHHAYLGGLLEHTVAVATLAVDLCAVHPRLDRDLLVPRRSSTTRHARASSATARRSS